MSVVSLCLGTSGRKSHKRLKKQLSRRNFALFFSGRTVVGSKKMTDGSTPEEKTTHCITAVGQNVNMFNIPWGDACRGIGFLPRKRRDLLLTAKENAIHCQGCLSTHETNQSSLPKAPPWFQTGRQGGEGRVAAGTVTSHCWIRTQGSS